MRDPRRRRHDYHLGRGDRRDDPHSARRSARRLRTDAGAVAGRPYGRSRRSGQHGEGLGCRDGHGTLHAEGRVGGTEIHGIPPGRKTSGHRRRRRHRPSPGLARRNDLSPPRSEEDGFYDFPDSLLRLQSRRDVPRRRSDDLHGGLTSRTDALGRGVRSGASFLRGRRVAGKPRIQPGRPTPGCERQRRPGLDVGPGLRQTAPAAGGSNTLSSEPCLQPRRQATRRRRRRPDGLGRRDRPGAAPSGAART